MSVCPLCNGEGQRIVLTKHKHTGQLKTVVQWCLCKKSASISTSPLNRILSWTGEYYLPLKEIDENLKFYPDNLAGSPNIIIKGCAFETFCVNVKSIIIKYRFLEPPSLIYCCRAIEILKKFYVQQEDDSSPGLNDTEKFDLLIIALGTREKNVALNTCLSQVIDLRLSCKKPTWLYLPEPTLSGCPQDYSQELEELIKTFKVVQLTNKNSIRAEILTEAKKKAANITL